MRSAVIVFIFMAQLAQGFNQQLATMDTETNASGIGVSNSRVSGSRPSGPYKCSNVVEEVSVADGQKLREQVVVQDVLGVKTWFGVPEVEVAQLRWREPEAQQVAIKMALMMVRCVPASEVSQVEIQAACVNEQLCGFSLSKFQSAVKESGSEVKLVQWVQAMEDM